MPVCAVRIQTNGIVDPLTFCTSMLTIFFGWFEQGEIPVCTAGGEAGGEEEGGGEEAAGGRGERKTAGGHQGTGQPLSALSKIRGPLHRFPLHLPLC